MSYELRILSVRYPVIKKPRIRQLLSAQNDALPARYEGE